MIQLTVIVRFGAEALPAEKLRFRMNEHILNKQTKTLPLLDVSSEKLRTAICRK